MSVSNKKYVLTVKNLDIVVQFLSFYVYQAAALYVTSVIFFTKLPLDW